MRAQEQARWIVVFVGDRDRRASPAAVRAPAPAAGRRQGLRGGLAEDLAVRRRCGLCRAADPAAEAEQVVRGAHHGFSSTCASALPQVGHSVAPHSSVHPPSDGPVKLIHSPIHPSCSVQLGISFDPRSRGALRRHRQHGLPRWTSISGRPLTRHVCVALRRRVLKGPPAASWNPTTRADPATRPPAPRYPSPPPHRCG